MKELEYLGVKNDWYCYVIYSCLDFYHENEKDEPYFSDDPNLIKTSSDKLGALIALAYLDAHDLDELHTALRIYSPMHDCEVYLFKVLNNGTTYLVSREKLI